MGIFWRALEYNVYILCGHIGIFYNHLVCFRAIWPHILRSFGKICFGTLYQEKSGKPGHFFFQVVNRDRVRSNVKPLIVSFQGPILQTSFSAETFFRKNSFLSTTNKHPKITLYPKNNWIITDSILLKTTTLYPGGIRSRDPQLHLLCGRRRRHH
jgi:hypothetical protein